MQLAGKATISRLPTFPISSSAPPNAFRGLSIQIPKSHSRSLDRYQFRTLDWLLLVWVSLQHLRSLWVMVIKTWSRPNRISFPTSHEDSLGRSLGGLRPSVRRNSWIRRCKCRLPSFLSASSSSASSSSVSPSELVLVGWRTRRTEHLSLFWSDSSCSRVSCV